MSAFTRLDAGRPKKFVDKEELLYLRQTLGFTWKEIASILGVSSKTLQRRADRRMGYK